MSGALHGYANALSNILPRQRQKTIDWHKTEQQADLKTFWVVLMLRRHCRRPQETDTKPPRGQRRGGKASSVPLAAAAPALQAAPPTMAPSTAVNTAAAGGDSVRSAAVPPAALAVAQAVTSAELSKM